MARSRKHQDAVRRLAERLHRDGWTVWADHSDWTTPHTIGERVPDIVAEKSGACRIIEVETEDTIDKHSDQQSTFRRSASQQNRTVFQLWLVDDDWRLEQVE